jgi:hypothetical protein
MSFTLDPDLETRFRKLIGDNLQSISAVIEKLISKWVEENEHAGKKG